MILNWLIPRLMVAYTNHTFQLKHNFDFLNRGNIDTHTLYIHIPFCRTLCAFCSFARMVYNPEIADEYFRALKQELQMYAERGYEFSEVYIGGGTPTVRLDLLVDLITWLKETWSILKVSVETSSSDLSEETLSALESLSVSRLSVGIQTFQDDLARQLGRTTGCDEQLLSNLTKAADVMDILNIDLIFNVPGQTESHIYRDLALAKQTGVQQISWYPLMRKDRYAYPSKKKRRNEIRLYRQIRRKLIEDFDQVSTWCFSKDRNQLDEYILKSNTYAGAGCGAIGFVGGNLYANTFSVPDYLQRVAENRLPVAGSARIGPGGQLLYRLLLSLFNGSIPFHSGNKLTEVFTRAATLAPALFGFGTIRKDRFILSAPGHELVSVLMSEFFTNVNKLRSDCSLISEPRRPVEQNSILD